MTRIISTFGSILLICVGFASAQGPEVEVLDHRWSERIETNNNSAASIFPAELGDPPAMTDGQLPTLVWRRNQFFDYEATVKNNTGKTIKGIAWNYVFSDLENKKIVRRHKLVAVTEIKKDATERLINRTKSPPTNLVAARDLERDVRSQYLERVEISCIYFSDNSVWKSGDGVEKECRALKEQLMRSKR